MLNFAGREFQKELATAWEDFNQTPTPPTLKDLPGEEQVFLPWFLFHWSPRPAAGPKGRAAMGIVALSFVAKSEGRLSELEMKIFLESVQQPDSFYEVLESKPGEGLVLRDVLIGGTVEVTEHSASKHLEIGDICYGQISRLPDINVLSRLAPIPIPPDRKVGVIRLRAKLRKRITRQNRELEEKDLFRYEEEIRGLYLDIRDALYAPPTFCNTDKELIEFHTLTYKVGSAQVAFDALAPLCWGVSKQELLSTAEIDRDGVLKSVEIQWRKKGNRKFETWENTVLGNISISGNSLVAEVNSAERAQRLRGHIEKRLRGLASPRKETIRKLDELLASRKRGRGKPAHLPSPGELSPEQQAMAQEQMQKEFEGWIHQKIPALGNQTPLAAVADPDGREMVEALLLSFERRNQPASPGIMQPDASALRRLLGLAPPRA